jgi:hypothetical protein
MSEDPADRRRYRRLQVPVYCRPAGVKLLEKRAPVDVSMGGVRIYSDQPFKVGESLKLEFFLGGEEPFTYSAEVVWIVPLEKGAPAKFDVGLKFTQLDPSAMRRLVQVLGPLEDSDA